MTDKLLPNTDGAAKPLSPAAAFSLETILGANHEAVEHPESAQTGQPAATGWDEETIETPVAEGYCIECEGKRTFGSSRRSIELMRMIERSACPGVMRNVC
jgi:hypothetical protein